ncbi:hypothetical protein WJX73_010688 [Symbiochloris irregularis]|uniref:Fe2OG dioxygenase domain-containing protein n=1 Tax=Symbiochloris irregularis TaxID=706552 RepID=A0AAW1NI12_9CHLO
MASTDDGPAREQGFSFGGCVKSGAVTLSLPETLSDKPKPELRLEAIHIAASAGSQVEEPRDPSEPGSAGDKFGVQLQLPGAKLKPLTDLCSQATCGLEGQNVVSEAHRRALKLSPESFDCSFRLEDTTILAEIERWAKPSPGIGVTAHLSSLNVYGPGDHFTRHKDSPQFGGRSFGTLVIGLPSRYTGGRLRVWNERGQIGVEHDWAKQLGGEDAGLQWAFIALGCWHEVQHVIQGHRLTLVYSLESSNSRDISNQFSVRPHEAR